jgi:predicted MFS family arabinose efflux permease
MPRMAGALRGPPSTPAWRDASTRALIAGCLTGFGVSWNLTNTGAIADTLSAHYDVGLGTVGLLTSATFFAEMVIMVPGGRAIDRWGAREISMLTLALCAVGNLLAILVPGIVAALVLRWVVGLGVGLGFLAGSMYAQSARRLSAATAQGLYGGVSLAGGGLALAAVPLAEGAFDWRAPYVTGTVIAALAACIVLLGPATRTRHPHEHAPARLRALLTDSRLVQLGLLHSATFGFSVVLGTWIVTLFERTADYGSAAAGVAGALVLVTGVAGRPLGGWLAGTERITPARLIALSTVLGAGATAILSSGAPGAFLIVAAAVVGLAAGLPFGLVFMAAARSFPHSPGAAIGAMNLYAVVTIVVGAPLLGITFSLPGDGRIGFAAVAVLWAVAATAASRAVTAHARAG